MCHSSLFKPVPVLPKNAVADRNVLFGHRRPGPAIPCVCDIMKENYQPEGMDSTQEGAW
jgi:hypothetical protein